MVTGDIITKSIIKPSSPTQQHLKNLKLSFLDQLAPPTYVHIILYFEPSHPHSAANLRRSFSDTLAVYYPFAGRLRDDSWVDCNDAGAEYVEARFSHVSINDVIKNPDTAELKKYVPAAPSGGDMPLAVQVSYFGCSGTAIGVCMWHKVADAMTMVGFINTWAAINRGDMKTVNATRPVFNLSSRFPPIDFGLPPPPPPPPSPETLGPRVVTKVFTFGAKKIEALRRAAAGPLLEKPTRVEAVTAFIWSHFMEAAEMRKGDGSGSGCVSGAGHVVDIRTRASPPLPRHFSGNALGFAMAVAEEREYYKLAMKLRESIREINGDHVRKLEDGAAFLKQMKSSGGGEEGKSMEALCFTSWARLPAYDVDFGWGKPEWVSKVDVPSRNLVIFLGTKCGDGIEAWVNMDEQDMATINSNFLLLDDHHVLSNC